jgi:class 3 adenylate cyclase
VPIEKNIGDWLESLGLSRYRELFEENDLDFDVLPDLTEEHLQALGLSLGHRLKLIRAIRQLSESATDNTSVESATPEPDTPLVSVPQPPSSGIEKNAERRTLTVMFVDLVGSTQLSTQLDPEDLRDVIRTYQEAATREIKRYDGFISRYMGDGILAYFGWPRAHEDDAERAVRAGAGANAVVANLKTPDGLPLAARTGVATGLVVVGDVIGEGSSEEEAVVGETPNLAARLQGIAEPGQLVVSQATRRLVGDLFHFESLGTRSLKGIPVPVEAFVVGSEKINPSRYHANRKAAQLPLIGRNAELDQLQQQWRITLSGEGQTVLISGEAGIGKSRIVDAFCAAAKSYGATDIIIQCSTHHTESALYPVWQWFLQASEVFESDQDTVKYEKVRAFVSLWMDAPEFADIAAANLALSVEPAQQLLQQSPDQLRIDTLNGLTSLFVAMADRHSAIMLLEDVHWIDPTTRGFLKELAARAADTRLMLIATTRPEGVARFSDFQNLNKIELNRLDRGASASIINQLTEGRTLPDELLSRLLRRTDGVPLYLEELTRTLLESGQLSDNAGQLESTLGVDNVDIPLSLQESLMARLDRLWSVREIAQTAAVIGREFNYDLLARVINSNEAHLQAALDQLLDSGLIYQRDQQSAVTYIFKHALIRDAAYNSLLKARLREIHATIADVLTTDPVYIESTEPQLLARHYLSAQNYERAIEFNLAAAQKALSNSANQEALIHAESGLKLVTKIAPPVRQQFAQGLYFSIAMAQRVLQGFHSTEYLDAMTKACDLAEENNDLVGQVNCVRGQFNHYFNRGQHKDGDDVIKRRLSPLLARLDTTSPGSTIGSNHLYRGELQLALDDLQQMLDGLDTADAYPERNFVLNPVTATLANMSWTKWLLGYPEQALADGMLAVRTALSISQPFSCAMATVWVGHVQCATGYTDDWESTLATTAELIDKYNSEAWAPRVRFLQGKFMSGSQDDAVAAQGRQEMQQAIKIIDDRGSRLSWTWLCGELATEWLQLSNLDACEQLLDSGIAHGEQHDERFWLPELYRLMAGVELRKGAEDSYQQWLDKSIKSANSQASRGCLLRTLTDKFENFKEPSGKQELSTALREFSEGSATTDLQRASRLLGG